MATRTSLITNGSDDDQPPRSRWQRFADAIFGYDFFISYAHSDGATYARSLAYSLTQQKFDCFLDTEEYARGDDWRAVGSWALKRTSRLVLIKTPGALDSEAVLREVHIFTARGKRVIPVEFDGPFRCDRGKENPLLELIKEPILRIAEPSETLYSGPSPDAVKELVRSFNITRQSTKRQRWLQGFVSALIVFLAIAVWQWEKAISAEREANASLLNSFFDRGETYLTDKPAAALNLGFQLSTLTDSERSLDLVHKALPHLPVWRIISEPVPNEEKWESGDIPFVTDPGIDYLLTARLESDNQYHLVLRDLNQDRITATSTLQTGEKLVRLDPPTARLFATALGSTDGQTLRLRALSATGLATVAAEIQNVRLFTCTNGDWPCYVISSEGTLVRVKQAQSPSVTIVAKLPPTWAFYAHPSGGAIALMGDGEVTWMSLRSDGTVHRRLTFTQLFPPRVSGKLRSSKGDEDEDRHGADVKFRWGPQPDEFLVASEGGGRGRQHLSGGHLSVTAVSVPKPNERNRNQPEKRWENVLYDGTEPIKDWIFETARDGTLVAVSQYRDLDEELIQVLDTGWKTIHKYDRYNSEQQWPIRGTAEHPLLHNYPAAFAPNGNYLVTSASNFRRSERYLYDWSGSYGRLQSWGVPDSLDEYEHVAVELPVDNNPMLRLVYSEDSSRLLALDYDRVFRIFNVAAALTDEKDRKSELWGRFDPTVTPFGRNLRYLLVRYSDTDVRYYDQVDGSEIPLAQTLGNEPIIAAESSDGIRDFTVVTRTTIVRFTHGGGVKRLRLAGIAQDADVQPDLTIIRSDNQALLYNTTSLGLLGTIELPKNDKEENERDPYSFFLSSLRITADSVLVYALKGDSEYCWTVRLGGLVEPRVRGPIRPISPSGNWLSEHDIIRSNFQGGRVLAEYGKHIDASSGPQFMNLATGEIVILPVPAGGWPDDLGHLKYTVTTRDGTILVLFDGNHNKYLLEWNGVNNSLPTLTRINFAGVRILGSFEVKGDEVYLLCTDDLDRDNYSLIRMRDGREVWRGADTETKVPPSLTVDGRGKVTVVNSYNYRQVRKRILLGGLNSPDSITNVRLPTDVQHDLDNLRRRMQSWLLR